MNESLAQRHNTSEGEGDWRSVHRGQSGGLRRSEVTLVDLSYFCQRGYNYRICYTRFHRKTKSFLFGINDSWKIKCLKDRTHIQFIFITINT